MTSRDPVPQRDCPIQRDDYPRANLTADIIIPDTQGRILLIRRGKEPCKGAWALPGGFLEAGQETLETCAVREAREETGLTVTLKRLVGVWSDPGRDPRGHTVTAVYETEPIPNELAQQAQAASDAAETMWIDPTSPEFAALELAFDHGEILGAAGFSASKT